ncbi:preprotein translocase subunit SecA [Alkanindiges sp. WGS2144]|uniref:preprotein translocase subunit SecA n=1 Tax=Alkanindiges sp. WGS2144 TaxID=3366808 RepID=UPI0037501834
MMLFISINLLTMALDQLLLSNVGLSAASLIGQTAWVYHYREQIHPVMVDLDEWITIYLVSELMLRWGIAIIFKHHRRWFFFPFIHWYEFLACIPTFRALRLLRVIVIGYRLYQLGYKVLPDSWLKTGYFYYQLLLQELTDRIVLTALSGVERELKTGATHQRLLHDLVNQHRNLISQAVGETLQHNLAIALQEQQQLITHNVGQIVIQAINDTPELHRLLRLIPVAGSILERQIQSIGQRLGENITTGLIAPFTQPAKDQPANPALLTAANYVGQIKLDQPALKKLVDSLVYESLNTIRKQIEARQWKPGQKLPLDTAKAGSP